MYVSPQSYRVSAVLHSKTSELVGLMCIKYLHEKICWVHTWRGTFSEHVVAVAAQHVIVNTKEALLLPSDARG